MNGNDYTVLKELKDLLTDQYLLTSRIIHASLGAGVFTFGIVIYALYSSGMSPGDISVADVSHITLLTRIHAGALLTVFPLSFYVFNRLIRQGGNAVDDDTHLQVEPAIKPEVFIMRMRTASIAQLAMMEAVAFLGLVICYLAVTQGVISKSPSYWVNAVSAVLMLAYIASTFPSRPRIEGLYQKLLPR